MSVVITLSGYAAPPRGDGIPFTKAVIEEAAASTGPWTAIETIVLNPVDTDPEHPLDRELTTTKGTLESGWYRVTWVDAAGHTSPPTEPVENLSALSGGIRPTVTDVAALLRARTKIIGGREVGTFDANTRPTADEVDDLISEAEAEVLGKVKLPANVGDEVDPVRYEARVRGAIRLYTAILVELSYFPEQIGTGKSPVTTYERLYDKRIAALEHESITGEAGGGEEGKGVGETPADAAYAFPAGTSGLVGWGSRW